MTHKARVVEPRDLEELKTLVARAQATGDASELEAFRESRHVAQGKSRDAVRVALDAKALADAVQNIRSLEHTPYEVLPGAKALLDAAYAVALQEREVSENANERLVRSASRLARLVDLEAPPAIVEAELPITLRALLALDTFDFTSRTKPFAEVLDEEIVDSCLSEMHVEGFENLYPTFPVPMTLLRGVDIFPRPKKPSEAASWRRFCGWFPETHPPRATSGSALSEAEERIRTYWTNIRNVPEFMALPIEERTDSFVALGFFHQLADFALEHDKVLVEWV